MTTTQHGFGNRPAAGSKRYACICGHVVKGTSRAEAFRRLQAHIKAETAPARTTSSLPDSDPSEEAT